MAYLTKQQLEKLSDLFLDLSKASFIGALAIPTFTGQNTQIVSKGLIYGLFFIMLCLGITWLKEA